MFYCYLRTRLFGNVKLIIFIISVNDFSVNGLPLSTLKRSVHRNCTTI